MKKIMVACVIVFAVAAAAYAFPSPAVDTYIQAIASLADPYAAIPSAPRGYGAVRDEGTGDFVILLPREYCGTSPIYMIPLGHTAYGGLINGYCQQF
jgi:hypothetical protein